MTAVLVAIGAAVGAPLRYLIDQAVRARIGTEFPWGTLAANVVGSFVLGLLVATGPSAGALALIGTGFCGGLTTFSTLRWDALSLARDGFRPRAAAYVAVSLFAALGAVTLGNLNAAGRTVVAVLHDLNMACRYADEIIAMRAGAVVAQGPPGEVVDADLVERVFGVRARVIEDPTTGAPLVLPEPRSARG